MDIIESLIEGSRKGLTLGDPSALATEHLDPASAEAARKAVLDAPDHTRYLVLMALRRDAPDLYAALPAEARARVLAGALAHLPWLNDFGYLDPGGSWDSVSAHALVETGDAARAPLSALLDDTSPAPLHGSETATMSTMYGYRRCDFAYRYLAMVLGETDPAFRPTAADRDTLIQTLRARLH